MNNKFQNPLQVLQEKSQEAWSGCIEIESPQDFSVCWNVYFLEGKIQYINSASGQQIRLDYLWQRNNLGFKCPQLEPNKASSEYAELWETLSDRNLSSTDIKKLFFRFIREGLVNVLSINQAKVKLVPNRRIKKAIISFTLEQLGTKLEGSIKSAQQINNYIPSPFSRLYLDQKNALQFYKIWKSKYNSPELEPIAKHHKLSSFVSLFVAKDCLYQIAIKANVDVHFIAKTLEKAVDEKLLAIFSFKELTPEELNQKQFVESKLANKTHHNLSDIAIIKDKELSSLIACIDDSKTVQKQVKMTLEAGGYQVLGITDPTLALKKLAQHQPAVIFLDINMPNINGYDLCSLLRKSQKFKDIPIVMLTGRDGMIDRVRAKLVGATDYLTKPCDPNRLITLTKALEKITMAV